MQEQIIDKLVWIDLETTGLNPRKDKIIEIAILVTDTSLRILDKNGFVAYLGISKEDVNAMSPVVKKMHTENGVIQKCLKSKLTLENADKLSVEYISKLTEKGQSPLCGNSICFDRLFIEYNMPNLSKHLHYRNIDVSTVKQLSRIWKNKVFKKEESTHEALSDIRASIEELKFYKKEYFE